MKFVTIEQWPASDRVDYRHELEAGNVLFFPVTPFVLPQEAQDFLRSLSFSGGAVHKNIAYRPASDRVTGIEADSAASERLVSVMRDYSRSLIRFTSELLPEYARAWKLDYASFRPLEEQGRDLPLNKRNDLIHTDAFPSRPTNGDLILRVFTNIHPSKTRNWVTTDPFPVIAEKYARAAGLEQIASGGKFLNQSARILKSFGLPVVPRSPYDRFMLRFHEYLKRNGDFQANCTKYHFDFPPGSTWLTFTDVLPHSVHSGQHALEQTFIIGRGSMADPGNAPVAVLERLCGRKLLEGGDLASQVA
ncbi:MAG: Kdo hydroxylase family protein [Acidobacteriaceae bacterium]|nr:Kdo hydroxylase family protein [Acidobacteriaceae bacterium]